MGFLAKRLAGLGEGGGGGVFCYVNSVFAPGLDEGVGGLWRVSAFFCFCFVLFWRGCVGLGWGGWKSRGDGIC